MMLLLFGAWKIDTASLVPSDTRLAAIGSIIAAGATAAAAFYARAAADRSFSLAVSATRSELNREALRVGQIAKLKSERAARLVRFVMGPEWVIFPLDERPLELQRLFHGVENAREFYQHSSGRAGDLYRASMSATSDEDVLKLQRDLENIKSNIRALDSQLENSISNAKEGGVGGMNAIPEEADALKLQV